jgi:four helix bundle protein
MSIAHREATESRYWLRSIAEAELLPAEKLGDLRDETEQIVRIIGAILVSSKRGQATTARTTITANVEPNGIA